MCQHLKAVAGILLLAFGSTAVAEEATPHPAPKQHRALEGHLMPKVVIKALDKVSAHVKTLELPVNQVAEFGDLKILVKKCWKAAPEERPQATAYIEILEHTPGDQPRLAFKGWMFAANPSLSAMEHPVYDVWLKDCTGEPLSESHSIPLPQDLEAQPSPASRQPSAPLEDEPPLNGQIQELLQKLESLDGETSN
ncbi:MAG: DUF2155 domain-containing protein [Holosporales bacterium]